MCCERWIGVVWSNGAVLGKNSVRIGISVFLTIWWEPRLWAPRTDQISMAGLYQVPHHVTPRASRDPKLGARSPLRELTTALLTVAQDPPTCQRCTLQASVPPTRCFLKAAPKTNRDFSGAGFREIGTCFSQLFPSTKQIPDNRGVHGILARRNGARRFHHHHLVFSRIPFDYRPCGEAAEKAYVAQWAPRRANPGRRVDFVHNCFQHMAIESRSGGYRDR